MNTKGQISCTVTAQLISTFVFASRIESLCFLNPKFQDSSHFLWLHGPVYLTSGQKPQRLVFSRHSSLCNSPIAKQLTYGPQQVPCNRTLKLYTAHLLCTLTQTTAKEEACAGNPIKAGLQHLPELSIT